MESISMQPSDKPQEHFGGKKNLVRALEDFSMTMQHALRQDVYRELEHRSRIEVTADVLPRLTPVEMFDYLRESDPNFYNWLFPFCPIVLSKDRLSPMHHHIIGQLYVDLQNMYNASQIPVQDADVQ